MSVAEPNSYRAIALKVMSVLMFVVMAALIKAGAKDLPPGEAVFFRSLFALPVIVGWLALRGELGSGLTVRRPLAHLWRGCIGTTAMALSFTGLSLLPLAEVKAIQYAVPVFVVVLAALFLGERIRAIRLAAVALGMVGVLVILWPRLTAFGADGANGQQALGALIVLAGSFCAAVATITVRRMVETEETAAIVFWFSVTATVLSLLTLPFGWTLPTPDAAGVLMCAGFVGGAGQILLTSAYRYGDASIVAPFDYVSMLFALAIGFVLFQEVPTPMMLLGAALVMAAGILIILRERHLRLTRGRGRSHVSKYG